MPFVAHVASRALRHDSVHDQRADVLFGLVVRRGNRRIINKQKITFAVFLKTLRQCNCLVVFRNESLNRLLNRPFVFVHQPFEANFRQFALAVNRREHRLDVLEQPFAVSLGVIERLKELDFADQMRPAELKKRCRFLFVFEIRTEKITADTAGKIAVGRFVQNFAAARGVDLEKGEKVRDKTPRPLQLAVLLEARFRAGGYVL